MKHNKKLSLKSHKLLLLTILSFIVFFIASATTTLNQPKTTTLSPSVPPDVQQIPELSPSPQTTATVSAAPNKVLVSTKSSEIKTGIKLPKKTYSLALIGDSMVETMGENTDYLQKSLAIRYPATEFKLYNYGVGGENIEQGLNRFNSPFNYKTRNYPPLTEVHPDILIVGSFSYNPFAEHDRNKHSRLLREMVNQARARSNKVYLLAEIAPLKNGFGKGIGGINWPEDQAALQAQHIIEQLDDTLEIAKTENIPLINAYQSSKVEGKYGNKVYVATHDGIHPSIQGHIFMADLIASIVSF